MTKLMNSLQTVRGLLRSWLVGRRQPSEGEPTEYPTQQNQYFT